MHVRNHSSVADPQNDDWMRSTAWATRMSSRTHPDHAPCRHFDVSSPYLSRRHQKALTRGRADHSGNILAAVTYFRPRSRRAADTSTNRRQGFLCLRTASVEQAVGRAVAAAVATTTFRRQLKTFGSSLPTDNGIQTDDCFMMCPRSSSRREGAIQIPQLQLQW